MREPQTKQINGNEWTVQPWPGRYGLKMQSRMAKFIGPALGGIGNVDDLLDQDVGAMVSALTEVMDDAPGLIESMLQGVLVDGKDISNGTNFDNHFSANFAELYEGLAFVIKVNFGDFSRLVGAIGGLAQPAGKDKAPSKTKFPAK